MKTNIKFNPQTVKTIVGIMGALVIIMTLRCPIAAHSLFNTYLGRLIMVTMVMTILWCNTVLGGITVVVIILAFFNLALYESFEQDTLSPTTVHSNGGNRNGGSNAKTGKHTNKNVSSGDHETKKSKRANDKLQSSDIISANNWANAPFNGSESAYSNSDAIEGFDMVTTERDISRGKQSAEEVVSKTDFSSDDVSPYEEDELKESYSSMIIR